MQRHDNFLDRLVHFTILAQHQFLQRLKCSTALHDISYLVDELTAILILLIQHMSPEVRLTTTDQVTSLTLE